MNAPVTIASARREADRRAEANPERPPDEIDREVEAEHGLPDGVLAHDWKVRHAPPPPDTGPVTIAVKGDGRRARGAAA